MTARRLRLLPGDRAGAVRANPSACLLAVALERQYGGKWSVSTAGAVQEGTGRTLRPGWHARQVITRFDVTGTMRRGGTVVTLHEQSRTRAPVRLSIGGGALAGIVLAVSGLWWVLVLAAVAAGALMTGAAVLARHPAVRGTRPAPVPPPPSWPGVPARSPDTSPRYEHARSRS